MTDGRTALSHRDAHFAQFAEMAQQSLGNAGGILVGNLLGRNAFDQAKVMGDRLCVLVAAVGVGTGLLIIAVRPLALQWAGLTPQATRYLSVMLFICAYYAACGCMTNLTIAGIFPAGGDSRFGLVCDAIVMWLVVVPIGPVGGFRMETAGIGGLCLLNTDECLKMIPALLHYRKYRWVNNVTRQPIPPQYQRMNNPTSTKPVSYCIAQCDTGFVTCRSQSCDCLFP